MFRSIYYYYKPMIKTINIEDIKVYESNMNKSTNIEEVKQSILDFGYNQHIIVDENNVIIAWHTRYYALKELGREKIEVFEKSGLSEIEKKEYRIIDNQVKAHNEIDDNNLMVELREIDDPKMSIYFDNLDTFLSEKSGKVLQDINVSEIEKAKSKLDTKYNNEQEENPNQKYFDCPHCGKHFTTNLNKFNY